MTFRRPVAVLTILALGAIAAAQPADKPAGTPAPKPDVPAQPAPGGPTATPAEQPAPKPAAGFPPAPKKQLYARNDLRGKPAPAFKVEKWLTPQPKREGKVVLIDFWATWCGPCRAGMSELEEWKKKFGDDLVIIGVSDEDEKTVRNYLKSRDEPVTYPMAIDTRAAMKKAVGVDGIPHVLIVDSKGIVRWQGFPPGKDDRLTEQVIRRIIDADKAANPPKPAPNAPPPAPAAPSPSADPAKPASP